MTLESLSPVIATLFDCFTSLLKFSPYLLVFWIFFLIFFLCFIFLPLSFHGSTPMPARTPLFKNYSYLFMCVWVNAYCGLHVEDNSRQLLLSFYHLDPRVKLRLSFLITGDFYFTR